MDNDHINLLLPHNARLKKVRVIGIVVVIVVAFSWSVKKEFGFKTSGSLPFYVQLNGTTYEGRFITDECRYSKTAWTNLKIKVTPQPVIKNSPGSFLTFPDDAWTCVSMDPPYHLKFKRSDGTLTESMRAVWEYPGPEVSDYYKWSSDGTSIAFGYITWSDISEFKLGTQWYLSGTLIIFGLSIVAAFAWILPFSFLIWVFTSRKMWYKFKAHECQSCGFDLRASEDRGCPECGWGREDDVSESSAEDT